LACWAGRAARLADFNQLEPSEIDHLLPVAQRRKPASGRFFFDRNKENSLNRGGHQLRSTLNEFDRSQNRNQRSLDISRQIQIRCLWGRKNYAGLGARKQPLDDNTRLTLAGKLVNDN